MLGVVIIETVPGTALFIKAQIDGGVRYRSYSLSLLICPHPCNRLRRRHICDLVEAVQDGGASVAAARSLFVFHGPLRGVLINFPSGEELNVAFLEEN